MRACVDHNPIDVHLTSGVISWQDADNDIDITDVLMQP
jgi:hypothetical protein